jgi:hypothetical protein
MSQQGDDKQADRPVRSSGSGCYHCGMTLPHRPVYGRSGRIWKGTAPKYCSFVCRNAAESTPPESAPSLSSSPVPVPLPERTIPEVGGVETGARTFRCFACGRALTVPVAVQDDGTLEYSWLCPCGARDEVRRQRW